MSFIDKSEKNIKRYLLKEVSGGVVGGFVGRAGKEIDDILGGGYHPEYGEIEDLLKKQVKDRKAKRKNLDSIDYGGESPLGGYQDIETDEAIETYDILYADDEARNAFNLKHTPVSNPDWELAWKEYYYDEPGEAYEFKEVKYDDNSKLYDRVKDIKYDDKPEYAGDDFINTSTTNWKFINREKK